MKKNAQKRRLPLRGRHLFIIGMIAVMLLAAFGDKGLMDVLKLKKERDGIKRQNAALEAENLNLEKEIGLLKTDNRYIEHIAKTELGMIGRDEVLYRIEATE